MLRLLCSGLLLLLSATAALAGAGTITVLDSTGTTKTYAVTTDGSGNFLAQTVICDATAAASCATVSGGAILVSGVGVAQGSSTAAQTLSPIGCRTLAAVATDTTAQTNMPRCMLDGSFVTSPVPNTNTGLTTYFVQPAASDNHVVIKAGAGQVYWISAFNNSATVNYLRLYNATTGFNGCNSATNLVLQVQIPASTSVGGASIPLPYGLTFTTGISICVTSGYATNDTTNATATAMSINIGYI